MENLLHQLEELQREHKALVRTNLILQRQKNRAVGICFELNQFWQQQDEQDDLKAVPETLVYDEDRKESSGDISEYSNEEASHIDHQDFVGAQIQNESQDSECEFYHLLHENTEDLLGKKDKKHEKYHDPQAKLKRQERLARIETRQQVHAQSRIGLFDLERACMFQHEKRKYRGRPRPRKMPNTKGKSKNESKESKKQTKTKHPKPYYRKRATTKRTHAARKRGGRVRNNNQRIDRLGIPPYQFRWYPATPNRPGYDNYRYSVNIPYYPNMYDRNPYANRRGSSILRHNISAVRRPRPSRSRPSSSKTKPNVGAKPKARVNQAAIRSRNRRGENTRRSTKATKTSSKAPRNAAKGTTSIPSGPADPARGKSSRGPQLDGSQ